MTVYTNICSKINVGVRRWAWPQSYHNRLNIETKNLTKHAPTLSWKGWSLCSRMIIPQHFSFWKIGHQGYSLGQRHLRKHCYRCNCGKRFFDKNNFPPWYYRVTSRLASGIIHAFKRWFLPRKLTAVTMFQLCAISRSSIRISQSFRR